MDHRCGLRMRLRFEVVIDYGGSLTACGHTRDIGLAGMCIEVPGLELLRNSMIGFCLRIPVAGEIKRLQSRAMVIHRDGGGTGLMFAEWNEPLLSALWGVLHGTPGQSSPSGASPSPTEANGAVRDTAGR